MGPAETVTHLLELFKEHLPQSMPISVKKFTRDDLIKRVFAPLGFKKGAEVGTAQGIFALFMCQNIPDLELTCVDPWKVYGDNPRAHPQEEQERCYRVTQEKLAPYKATLVRAKSMEYVDKVPDKSLDFAYIDGNHSFDFVMRDIIEWSRKVRSGGIVAGDDFYRFKWAGVIEAAEAYTRAHNINPWFVTRESEPSFFWVKP